MNTPPPPLQKTIFDQTTGDVGLMMLVITSGIFLWRFQVEGRCAGNGELEEAVKLWNEVKFMRGEKWERVGGWGGLERQKSRGV